MVVQTLIESSYGDYNYYNFTIAKFYRFISNIKAHDGTTESPLPENVENRGSIPIRIPRDKDYACRLVKNMLKR